MPFVEFVGQSRSDADHRQGETSRLINCYREPMEGGHRIKSVPGTTLFADIDAVFMKDMAEIGGEIYTVCGGTLFGVSSTGSIANIGSVTDGDATISGNNGKVTVAAGGVYYVWDGTDLTTPTGGAFTATGSVEFIGQTTVMTEKDGRRFQWSAVADPTTINALDFATAEGRDDDILRAVVINGNLWLMKEKSCEIWYQSGVGFTRIAGGVLDTGLKAFGLVAKFDGGAFFVGDDGVAYITNGAGLQPVSTTAVETDISQGSARRCFYYEDEGHKFCVIQFSDRFAWVYDLATGEWHNRASGTELNPWRVVAAVKAFGYWHVGGDLGNILRLGRTNADDGAVLVRKMTSRTLLTGQYQTISRFEVLGRSGEVDISGREPAVMLRVSKDRGKTWGAEKWRTFGAIGDYDKRVVWRALGRARQFTVELTITDPVELPIQSQALLEAV